MNNRRSFVQQLGLLSAGLAITPILSSCNSSEKTAEGNSETDDAQGNWQQIEPAALSAIGLQLYTLRDQLPQDVKGVIAKVAKTGYQDVETFGYSTENGFWSLDAKAFKELLQANNLVSSSGHYDFGPYMANGNTDIVKTNIEAGLAVGQEFITVPYLGEEVRGSADAYKAIAEKLNKAGEMCKEANLKLAYHNHDFEFKQFGDTTGYNILLNETDPSLVSLEADLYWFVRGGQDPVSYFEKNPGRFALWHVKDMDKTRPKLNTEIGSGSIDFSKIFGRGSQAGVKRIFVEQENFAESMDPFQSIAQSYTYIKSKLL